MGDLVASATWSSIAQMRPTQPCPLRVSTWMDAPYVLTFHRTTDEVEVVAAVDAVASVAIVVVVVVASVVAAGVDLAVAAEVVVVEDLHLRP